MGRVLEEDVGRALTKKKKGRGDRYFVRDRKNGELRDPGDEIRQQVLERLMSVDRWDAHKNVAPAAQVVDAVNPWWLLNQDSTLAQVLADLIAPRPPEPEIDRLRLELRESRAEVARLRAELKSAGDKS